MEFCLFRYTPPIFYFLDPALLSQLSVNPFLGIRNRTTQIVLLRQKKPLYLRKRERILGYDIRESVSHNYDCIVQNDYLLFSLGD